MQKFKVHIVNVNFVCMYKFSSVISLYIVVVAIKLQIQHITYGSGPCMVTAS